MNDQNQITTSQESVSVQTEADQLPTIRMEFNIPEEVGPLTAVLFTSENVVLSAREIYDAYLEMCDRYCIPATWGLYAPDEEFFGSEEGKDEWRLHIGVWDLKTSYENAVGNLRIFSEDATNPSVYAELDETGIAPVLTIKNSADPIWLFKSLGLGDRVSSAKSNWGTRVYVAYPDLIVLATPDASSVLSCTKFREPFLVEMHPEENIETAKQHAFARFKQSMRDRQASKNKTPKEKTPPSEKKAPVRQERRVEPPAPRVRLGQTSMADTILAQIAKTVPSMQDGVNAINVSAEATTSLGRALDLTRGLSHTFGEFGRFSCTMGFIAYLHRKEEIPELHSASGKRAYHLFMRMDKEVRRGWRTAVAEYLWSALHDPINSKVRQELVDNTLPFYSRHIDQAETARQQSEQPIWRDSRESNWYPRLLTAMAEALRKEDKGRQPNLRLEWLDNVR